MSLQRSLSADNLAELSSSDWLHQESPVPRLMFYNDGTGCVLELRRPGDSEANCGEHEGSEARELPVNVARVVQRLATFLEDLSDPCSRHFFPTVLSMAIFGGIIWVLTWYLSTYTLSPVSGTPIFFGQDVS